MGKEMPQAEAILVFRNVHGAIMGERFLLDIGIDTRVMPMPRSIGPACGMVLRVSCDDVEKARAVLGESLDRIYRREGEGIVPWPV